MRVMLTAPSCNETASTAGQTGSPFRIRHNAAAVALAAVLSIAAPAAHAGTPFRLGAYLGNPNGSSASAEAAFEASFSSFTARLKAKPRMILSYIDYTQAVAAWPSNTSWQAWSNAQSKDAKNLLPVIGLPMYSIAGGAPTPDQQFQAFANGQYDAELYAIVQAWQQQAFKNLVFRPGWEMNTAGNTYVGSDSQSQSDWVAAFRHIHAVLKKAAQTYGVTAKVVWNPNVTNYASVSATGVLYPGNAYVDIIAADMYADMYPYSDGTTPPTYHDWDTGGEDTSIAQFIADPINRAHYWTYPAATRWSNDSSQGHSQSFTSLLAFAQQQGKPFAVCETGAGNSNAATDVQDDPTFPQWLAQTLHSAGLPIEFVNIWDSNGGGNYEFSFADDNKPQEAKSWGTHFGN